MARMIRKQVYVEPRQDALLKRRAKELGVTEAELTRRGIDQIARAPAPFIPDLQAWQQEKAFILDRMRLVVPQTGRGWTRDELYEDRIERCAR